jgi:hypothetical protein
MPPLLARLPPDLPALPIPGLVPGVQAVPVVALRREAAAESGRFDRQPWAVPVWAGVPVGPPSILAIWV